MKHFSKIIIAVLSLGFLFASCDKADDLPFYGTGTSVLLTSSVSSIAPAPADSNNTVVTFSWTNPKHEQDSSLYKYVIEIDSTTRNFTKAVSKSIIGTKSISYTAKEINNILLSFGFAYNTAYDLDVRVTSSYGNNNEQLRSNTVKINFKTYKVPPKVALPAGSKLWANGGALPWSWTGNPPTPQSEFSRLDNETWGAVFNLGANNEFLVLSQNGGTDPYNQKYAVPNNTIPTITAGGDFGFYPPGTGGDNFKSPAAAGWYKMEMNFQSGKFTISSFGTNALAQDLYITGSGTPSSWTNTPPPAQKFTRLNAVEYELTMAFTPGGEYKFLSSFGNWQPQFGGSSATGGQMGANYGGGSDPNNIPTPAVAGNYKINVNFFTNVYTVTKL